jgi:hypothetical protein
MKKIFLFLAFIVLSHLVWSQTETSGIIYTYDNAGNRTSRMLEVKEPKIDTTSNTGDSILSSQVDNKLIGDATTIQQQIELIQKYGLKVFPNPTEGKLNLVIENNTNNLKGEIRLYQQTGSLLLSQKSISSSNLIDLSNKPSGTYILELLIENKGVQWKIIKK